MMFRSFRKRYVFVMQQFVSRHAYLQGILGLLESKLMIIMRVPGCIKQQSSPIMLEIKKRDDDYVWHAQKLSICSDRNIRTAMYYVTGLNPSIRVVKEDNMPK